MNNISEMLSIEEAFRELNKETASDIITERAHDPKQLSLFDCDDADNVPLYSLNTAVRHYFGERRMRVSNPGGQHGADGNKLLHHTKGRGYPDVVELTVDEHNAIHNAVFNRIETELMQECVKLHLSPAEIARILQGLAYSENAQMYIKKEQAIANELLADYIADVNQLAKNITARYPDYVAEATEEFLRNRDSEQEQNQTYTQLQFDI